MENENPKCLNSYDMSKEKKNICFICKKTRFWRIQWSFPFKKSNTLACNKWTKKKGRTTNKKYLVKTLQLLNPSKFAIYSSFYLGKLIF